MKKFDWSPLWVIPAASIGFFWGTLIMASPFALSFGEYSGWFTFGVLAFDFGSIILWYLVLANHERILGWFTK